MTYENFINELNNKKIKKIEFYIEGYSHYNNCSIEYFNTKFFGDLITCNLTKDSSEKVSFFKTFNEKEKLFRFGSKGKFTLKEVWSRVVVKNIEYFNEE